MGSNMPTYTRSFWGKAFPRGRMGPERVHLLEHHLADVGACLEALLAQATIRQRLANTAGRADLDDATAARLAVFAALHDIGKVNVGFQTQVWREGDLNGRYRPMRAGHTSVLLPVVDGKDGETAAWFFDALGWEDILSWDDSGGLTASGLLVAALSHHGRPLHPYDSLQPNPRLWRGFGKLHPRRFVERVARSVRQWFPAAFRAEAPPLPSAPEFQHMFMGLCNLADWIGSDEELFPYVDDPNDGYMATARERARRAVMALGLNVEDCRKSLPRLPAFGELFAIDGSPRPNAIQVQAARKTPLDERLVIIESETGSGKTEAALLRFAGMYRRKLVDGLYFALPTRAAARQLHDRVTAFAARMFPEGQSPEPVLAVPGYVRAGEVTGTRLPGFEVLWDDDPEAETRRRRWAAESAKRFLAAKIAVGTVDQAMLAALQVKHSHLRAACLARNLLVVDEVHASDPYMRVILEALLNAHLEAGGHALLMSATLGSAARRQWLLRPRRASDLPKQSLREAIGTAYPAVSTRDEDGEIVAAAGENDRRKTVRLHILRAMHDFAEAAGLALAAARSGAKVLVVRNTVDYAVRTQRAVEAAAGNCDEDLMFRLNGKPTLHTGRFAAEDRLLLDAEVEARLGKQRAGGGCVVVGTQTLEQSLDIDADLLITDLCPMDVLLQRIGRLHRHHRDDRPYGLRETRCIVLLPPHDDLTPLLERKPGGPARNGLGGYVYPDLRVLELTRRLVVEHATAGKPWRIPAMNRELVERTTHPDALEELVEAMGGRWIEHGSEVEGVTIADRLTARNVIVRRDLSFLEPEVAFADAEEAIRTRLGEEGVEVMFAPPPESPFAAASRIGSLAVPAHMSRGLTGEEPAEPVPFAEGFTFSLDERGFVYDRLGLRRL